MTEFFLFFENKHQLLEINHSYIIGRDKTCDIVLADRHVSRRHACLSYKPDCFVLTDLQSQNGTWYEGQKIQEIVLRSTLSFRIADCNMAIRSVADHADHQHSAEGDTMIFETKMAGIIDQVGDPALAAEINILRNLYNRKKEKLAELAFHDTLTKLYNRRFFDTKILEEITRSLRYKHPLSLLMIDIDHFKQFNDTYGHQKGDEVLAAVAEILTQALRNEDIICRYGGEEIVVILPETAGKSACKAAETARAKIELLSKKTAGVVVTVSIGVAELSRSVASPESLIHAADTALYQAKESGRNKVVMGLT